MSGILGISRGLHVFLVRRGDEEAVGPAEISPSPVFDLLESSRKKEKGARAAKRGGEAGKRSWSYESSVLSFYGRKR